VVSLDALAGDALEGSSPPTGFLEDEAEVFWEDDLRVVFLLALAVMMSLVIDCT
jgi:hypothetical protein